jgi:hypothetical protein
MAEEIEPETEAAGYEPPMVVRLGSLTELTQGGTGLIGDGTGGAGDTGSA